jgi:hypothetical protein
MELLNLNEASKLNPGKNAIKASLLGSRSASVLVKTSQAALKQWPSLNREKKKEVYAKLAELKKAARENMRTEIKGVKPEQKTAAAEKATQMYASFVAAVKKREKTEGGEEETKVDVSALEKERDEIKDWLVNAQDELMKAIEGKSEEDAYKIALKMQDDAIVKAKKYNDLIAKIEDANKSNESYKILTEWFDILLEFDADKIVDKIKDKVENIEKKVEGGEDSKQEPEEEDDDAKRDALLDELDELEEQDRDLESELDDADSERKDAIAAYNDAAAKHKEAKDSGADQDMLYDLDDAEYEAEEKKGYAIDDYNKAKSRIEKERGELAKKMKEVKDKIKTLQPRKNESRIIMTFDNFITERYHS